MGERLFFVTGVVLIVAVTGWAVWQSYQRHQAEERLRESIDALLETAEELSQECR
jgi:predicted negative regulator of RcsB-dependent stress response